VYKRQKLRKAEKYDPAIKIYSRIVKLHPDHDLASASAFYIGQCYFSLGKMKEAVAQLKGMIDQDDKGSWRGVAYLLLGGIYLEYAFDADQAKQWYESCLKHFEVSKALPGWGVGYQVHQRMGIIAYVEDDHKAAIEWFEKASKLDPPRFYVDAHGTMPSGVEVMADKLRRGEEIVPKVALGREKRARLMMTLGEVYYIS